MTNLDKHWPEILELVRQNVAQQTFNTWFKPLQPLNTDTETVDVHCPDRFFLDWFSEHHLPILTEAATAYFGAETTCALQVNAAQVQRSAADPDDRERGDARIGT